jgi:hypothetical protein
MTEMNKKKQKKTIILSLFVLTGITLISIAILALTSLSIEPDLPIEHVIPYPYTTKYIIEIVPDETIHIGSVSLNLSSQEDNSIGITINEERSIMNFGDSKEITERRAQISLFGNPIFETNYRVNVTYQDLIPHTLSEQDHSIFLDAKIETSKQIPEFILSPVIPVDISISTAA